MSTITANDLVLNLVERHKHHDQEEQMAFALKVSHIVLVVIAVAAFIINLQPPRLLGIFGQVGVYGLTAAAAPPLLLGVLFRRVPLLLVWGGSATAITLHFVLFFKGAAMFPGSSLTFANPGVTVSIATLAVLPPMLIAGFLLNRRAIS